MMFQSTEKLGKIGSLSLGIQNTLGHPVRLYFCCQDYSSRKSPGFHEITEKCELRNERSRRKRCFKKGQDTKFLRVY